MTRQSQTCDMPLAPSQVSRLLVTITWRQRFFERVRSSWLEAVETAMRWNYNRIFRRQRTLFAQALN